MRSANLLDHQWATSLGTSNYLTSKYVHATQMSSVDVRRCDVALREYN